MFANRRSAFSTDTLKRLRVVGLFIASVSGLTIVARLAQSDSHSESNRNYLVGSLPDDKPRAVYATDPQDSWNRIFYCLFTHTVQTRLTSDFTSGAPFYAVNVTGRHLKASTRTFARIESGDRAIEPFYFLFSGNSFWQALNEARSSQLESALTEALEEKSQRSALHRALMQSDVWAAYDILSQNFSFEDAAGNEYRQRKSRLKALLARFIKKLALTSQEINTLPDNYAIAVKKHLLPDLFATNGDWMEIEWLPERDHDRMAHYRRAVRVFIKPSAPPLDTRRFLDSLRSLRPERLNDNKLLDSVVLLEQNLLINTDGEIVPSRLTNEMQLRRFSKNEAGKADFEVHELSRQLFLTNPETGGLRAAEEQEPDYLPTNGNDFDLATSHVNPDGTRAPILAPLRSRCVSCHGDNLQVVRTLNYRIVEPIPPIRQLNPANNDRSRHVAERKKERADFKALKQQWFSTIN